MRTTGKSEGGSPSPKSDRAGGGTPAMGLGSGRLHLSGLCVALSLKSSSHCGLAWSV